MPHPNDYLRINDKVLPALKKKKKELMRMVRKYLPFHLVLDPLLYFPSLTKVSSKRRRAKERRIVLTSSSFWLLEQERTKRFEKRNES